MAKVHGYTVITEKKVSAAG
ncbi:hypothetical protein [Bradyrhizobium sp. CCGUVB14]